MAASLMNFNFVAVQVSDLIVAFCVFFFYCLFVCLFICLFVSFFYVTRLQRSRETACFGTASKTGKCEFSDCFHCSRCLIFYTNLWSVIVLLTKQ